MKQSKSFWSGPNLWVAVLCGSACATLVRYSEQDLRVHTSTATFIQLDQKRARTRQDIRPMGTEGFLDSYCHGGKQVAPLTSRITGVLPRPQTGVPSDEAARNGQILRDALTRAAANLFLDDKAFDARDEWSPFLPITPSSDAKSFVALAKQEIYKWPDPGFTYASAYQVGTGDAERNWPGCPTILAFQSPEPTIVTSLTPLPLARVKYGVTLLSGNKMDKSNGHIRLTNQVACGLTAVVNGDILESRAMNGDAFRAAALRPATFLEPHSLREHYTMLIPYTVQKSVFGSDHNLLFVSSDGTFDLKSAVEDRQRLWRIYFQTFTKVKIVQSPDPQVVNYEVSLDLNLPCAYGRPVSDLIAK